MKKLIFYLFFACFFPFFSAFAEPVTQDEAKNWANQKGSEILNIISSKDADKYAKLDAILLNDVDIKYIGKFVVGKYWKTMTPDQQSRYQALFEEYLLKLYKTFNLNFDASDIDFAIYDIRAKEKYTDIIMSVAIQGITTQSDGAQDAVYVTFRVHKTDGKIKLIDLKVAESSLAVAYRNRFYEQIIEDDEEIEWFLEDFETWIPSGEQIKN